MAESESETASTTDALPNTDDNEPITAGEDPQLPRARTPAHPRARNQHNVRVDYSDGSGATITLAKVQESKGLGDNQPLATEAPLRVLIMEDLREIAKEERAGR